MTARDTRHGIGVSPGIAVGPVVQVRPPAKEPASADPVATGQLVRHVLESVAVTLEDRAARADATAQSILTAAAMMARDPGLIAADGGHHTGTPIGVCGEAAADPLLALVLTGLGVSSLSMAPTRVPAVRAALSVHDLGTCTAMAAAARAARSPQDARDAVLALADKLIADLV